MPHAIVRAMTALPHTMPAGAPVAPGAQPKTVRDCDGCTLCCKVMEVEEIAKPGGKWCPHCRTSSGCGIYETRPRACTAYVCGYLTIAELGPEWKPAHSRLVLPSTVEDGSIIVRVDPARPDAWKREPYFASMKNWARQALAEQRRVIVYAGGHSIVVLPDHAADLGDVRPDELIVILSGTSDFPYEAYAVKRDAWAQASQDIGLGKVVTSGAEGFRKGRLVG